jgi:polysaccharide export outer membrane protein
MRLKKITMEPVKNFKLFLVDDDEFNLQLTSHHLGQLGYTDIHLLKNGTECLNNLTHKPEVIFLDHNMGDISGFEVLKKIKRFDPNIYVVMLSGQDSMKTAVDSLKYGAFDYIIKGDDSLRRITDVVTRITEIQEHLEMAKPTIWKKLGRII